MFKSMCYVRYLEDLSLATSVMYVSEFIGINGMGNFDAGEY